MNKWLLLAVLTIVTGIALVLPYKISKPQFIAESVSALDDFVPVGLSVFGLLFGLVLAWSSDALLNSFYSRTFLWAYAVAILVLGVCSLFTMTGQGFVFGLGSSQTMTYTWLAYLIFALVGLGIVEACFLAATPKAFISFVDF